jgi:aryl-alcohol dehydrogenase-like predicted oxidoreductase
MLVPRDIIGQAMPRRQLGRTGLLVTPIGLGLAALGRPGYVNLGHAEDLSSATDVEAMRRRSAAVLDAAWDAGIRYIDAARSYGRAEEFLADWLDRRSPAAEELTVGTKWGYTYTAEWQIDADVHEVKDHSLATLRRQWAESRALLGSRINLLQVHSATLESGILDDRPVLEALAALRHDGAVRAIGLSLSGPEQAATLQRAMRLEQHGRRIFDVVQATWNALEPSAGPMLAEARASGLGVIVKEALANGRLVRGDAVSRLRPHADRLGCGVDALAIACALAQPWADVVLWGAATIDQVRSNVTAIGLELDDEARAALADLAERPADYWQRRAQLAWN